MKSKKTAIRVKQFPVVALLIFLVTIATVGVGWADNEIQPLSNIPDAMTCDASKLFLISGLETDFGPVAISVQDRALPSLHLQLSSSDGTALLVVGNGHVGTSHQNRLERCGFLTTQSSTTHYTCNLYDGPRQPTYLDWKREGRNTLVKPDRVCSGMSCYILKNCKVR